MNSSICTHPFDDHLTPTIIERGATSSHGTGLEVVHEEEHVASLELALARAVLQLTVRVVIRVVDGTISQSHLKSTESGF